MFRKPVYSNEFMKHLNETGYEIVKTETDLNGPQRFAADNMATASQCQSLMDLANVGEAVACMCFLSNTFLFITDNLVNNQSFV